MEECPCIDCICIPICRHKRYMNIFRECILLRTYEPGYCQSITRSKKMIQTIYDLILPTMWRISYSDRWTLIIREDNINTVENDRYFIASND